MHVRTPQMRRGGILARREGKQLLISKLDRIKGALSAFISREFVRNEFPKLGTEGGADL